jgi:2-dehydro-3-deoxygluconokinase
VLVSFDVNYRARLWSPDAARGVLSAIAARADVVFASDDELHLIAAGDDEASRVRALLDGGVREVVLTRGGDGSAVFTATESAASAARSVAVVDTIGAGDAFTAGYLSALLDGLPLADRLDRGAVLGAFAVSASGDWESLPLRSELALLDHAAGTTLR